MASRQRRTFAGDDLGKQVVDGAYEVMQVDEGWAIREERSFTWWGAWVRQRVWAGEAITSAGETLWQVRARTPALLDMPDAPETYASVNALNTMITMSAYAFDPDDGTVSARCGGLVYDQTIGWFRGWLVTAIALQVSIVWGQVPPQAGNGKLDRLPHPHSGERLDADDMMNVAGAYSARRPPLSDAMLKRIGRRMAKAGLPAQFDERECALKVLLKVDADLNAVLGIGGITHPVHGPGMLVHFHLLEPNGALRAEWLANALNLAEASDWSGEVRPPALGAWLADGDTLQHVLFLPAGLLDHVTPDEAELVVRNLVGWAELRADFIAERLPWLRAAAVSRYPDDDPPDRSDDEDDEDDDDEDVPLHERSWGPAVRAARPPAPATSREAARELVVDPSGAGAFKEIDDAVAAAEDGDTVRVRPGVYRKPVLLDRAVAVVADGPVAAVVLEPVGGECFGVAASGGSVTGLTIRPARAGNDGADYSAVSVRDAAVTVERCVLSSHLGATVWVGGPSSMAVLRDCQITDGSQNGVFITEEGRGEVAGCRIHGNRWPIVVAGPHASLRLVDCRIEDNLDAGAATWPGAVLALQHCTVSGNGSSGLVFQEAAPSSAVTDCTISGNAGAGIAVRGGRGLRVVGNRLERNSAGIVVDEGASPSLEDNRLDDNTDVGIGVTGDMTNPVVLGNAVTSNRPAAIVVRQGAAGTFERNVLHAGDAAGVWVADDATRPIFRSNIVSGGRGVGIRVSDGGGGQFESNDLRGNADGSWDLDEPGDLRRTGNLEDTGRRPEPGSSTSDHGGARLN